MKPCPKETKRLELELGGQELTQQVYVLFLVQKEKKKKEEAGREEWKREDDREEGKRREEAEAKGTAGIL